jgi:CBS domain-containing protein
LPQSLRVAEAIRALSQTNKPAVLVVDEAQALLGVLEDREIEEAERAGRGEELLSALLTTPLISIFADESLSAATRQMGMYERKALAVLARGDGQRPVGLVSRDDIFYAYSIALQASSETSRKQRV